MNEEGIQTGRKAKNRLILKGYMDPELVTVPREAATLSTLGRNLIFALVAQRQFRLGILKRRPDGIRTSDFG